MPIGYMDAFLAADSHSSPFPVPVPAVRSAAVQLLISYMGATLGSLAAVRAFVQQAVDGYRCGLHSQVELRMSGVTAMSFRHRCQRIRPVASAAEFQACSPCCWHRCMLPYTSSSRQNGRHPV